MRLLFAASSLGWRGTEVHLDVLTRALLEKGTGIAAWIPEGSELAGRLHPSVQRFHGRHRNALDLAGMRSLSSAVARFRPDWLFGAFGHEYVPLSWVASRARVPLALFRHLAGKPLSRATRLILERADHRVIAVSRCVHRVLIEGGLPERLSSVLVNPIDVARFRPRPEARASVRAELGLEASARVIGFIGPHTEGKGGPLLRRALDRVMEEEKPLRALWVLPPGGRSMMEREGSLRHRVVEGRADLERLVSAMDWLAVPSIGPEAFGRVSVEAQACGVPVLVSDLGGLPETLDPGRSGRLVSAGDEEAWVGALRDSRNPRAQWEEMGRAGRAFVTERFAAPDVADELLTWLSRAASP